MWSMLFGYKIIIKRLCTILTTKENFLQIFERWQNRIVSFYTWSNTVFHCTQCCLCTVFLILEISRSSHPENSGILQLHQTFLLSLLILPHWLILTDLFQTQNAVFLIWIYYIYPKATLPPFIYCAFLPNF